MVDRQAVRDCTDDELIRDAMRHVGFSVDAHHAVAKPLTCAAPDPAIWSTLHESPETVHTRLVLGWVGHLGAAGRFINGGEVASATVLVTNNADPAAV